MTVAWRLTRRGFAALATTGLAAGYAILHAHARQSLPKSPATATPQTGDTSTSRLMIAQSQGDLSFATDLLAFDAGLAHTATIEVEDSVLSLYPTPDPAHAVISGLSAPAILDLGGETARPIQADTGAIPMILPPTAVTGGPGAFGNHRFVASGLDLLHVLLVDAETGASQDITEWVVPPSQQIAPSSATFGARGEVMGLWTGNWVWFVDVNAPDEAYPLDADRDDLYSTTFDISSDEQWLAYTVYEPGTATGESHVVLQRVDDREPVMVADGTAWSAAEFVPGLPDRFLLSNEGTLELRSLADPTAPGDSLGTVGTQPSYLRTATSDGMRQAIGASDSDTDPLAWHLLDLEAGTLDPLDALAGCSPLRLTTWGQEQRYALFGPATGEDGKRPAGDVIGLDLASGETFTLLEQIVIPDVADHSTSSDGSRILVQSANKGKTKGAWVLDLANRTVAALPYGEDRRYTRAVSLHPDGSVGAIAVSRPRWDETEVLAFDPANPEALTFLAEGELLGWT